VHQPIDHALEIFGEGRKQPHGVIVPCRRYGDKHFSCANIYTGGVGLQHRTILQAHSLLLLRRRLDRASFGSASFACGLLIVARFLSLKQQPSCAREGTLPNGISWARRPQLLTTALRTEPGTNLFIDVLKHPTAKTAYFRGLMLDSRMHQSPGPAKFLAALPRHLSGPNLFMML